MASDAAQRRTMARFLIATFFYWASLYVYVPVLAVHAQNLGASMALIGIVVSAYGFSQLVLRVPIGIWSDRIGTRKPFLMAGFVSAALAGLGMGAASNPEWLVVFRGVSGVAAAAWVVFTVLFASYFAPHQATKAVSQVTFVGGIAEMLSGFLGGIIAENWGWSAPFYVAAAFALAGLAVIYPLKEAPLAARHSPTPRELLRTSTKPMLLVVSLVAMLTSWTQWVTVYGFTPVYAAALGASRADLGMLTAITQFGYTIFVFAAAYSAEWIGQRATVLVGLFIQATAALMVPLVDNLWLVGLSQLLGGLGRGLSRPVLMGLSIQSVSAADRATAMGVFQAVYALGMFGGPATGGFVADTLGLTSVFIIAGAATLLGIPAVLARVPKK